MGFIEHTHQGCHFIIKPCGIEPLSHAIIFTSGYHDRPARKAIANILWGCTGKPRLMEWGEVRWQCSTRFSRDSNLADHLIDLGFPIPPLQSGPVYQKESIYTEGRFIPTTSPGYLASR
jgi:hypothetical protein